jgi:polyisoprenoid-binding protein YceI
MKLTFERVAIIVLVIFSTYGYIASCSHDDEILASSGPDITRGTQKCSLTNPKVSFDKAHSNVQWSTLYLGATSLLTGRFDNFGFDKFEFDESNAAGISFKAWVWLNTVNTSEPGRDDGCLLTTFGTNGTNTTQPENLAIIESTSVTLSTTDKGYIIKANLTFHGATHEVSCKMRYDGKTMSGPQEALGFGLEFPFLAKKDFGIVSTNIGDNVDVKCNALFRINP